MSELKKHDSYFIADDLINVCLTGSPERLKEFIKTSKKSSDFILKQCINLRFFKNYIDAKDFINQNKTKPSRKNITTKFFEELEDLDSLKGLNTPDVNESLIKLNKLLEKAIRECNFTAWIQVFNVKKSKLGETTSAVSIKGESRESFSMQVIGLDNVKNIYYFNIFDGSEVFSENNKKAPYEIRTIATILCRADSVRRILMEVSTNLKKDVEENTEDAPLEYSAYETVHETTSTSLEEHRTKIAIGLEKAIRLINKQEFDEASFDIANSVAIQYLKTLDLTTFNLNKSDALHLSWVKNDLDLAKDNCLENRNKDSWTKWEVSSENGKKRLKSIKELNNPTAKYFKKFKIWHLHVSSKNAPRLLHYTVDPAIVSAHAVKTVGSLQNILHGETSALLLVYVQTQSPKFLFIVQHPHGIEWETVKIKVESKLGHNCAK